jgi:hypothetical protein
MERRSLAPAFNARDVISAHYGLDHLLILHEKQLSRILQAYVKYFNQVRPHQGLKQHNPGSADATFPARAREGPILSRPILGGLHHDYHRVACRTGAADEHQGTVTRLSALVVLGEIRLCVFREQERAFQR